MTPSAHVDPAGGAAIGEPGLTIVAYGLVLAIAVALLGFIAWSLGRLAGDREEPSAPRPVQPRRTGRPASRVGNA
jgi:hypothetical protein